MKGRDFALLTDLYELTMMQGYYETGAYNRKVVFDLFYRKNPSGNGFAITAGLQQAIEYLDGLHFTEEDIAYLESLNLFSEDFIDYLRSFRFTGEVYAVPEGTIVFPHEPLMRIKAPIIEAQLIETALLNIINHQSLIATKANRIVRAAEGRTVLEFGSRRAQGADAAILGARAAYIGGCTATSNVLASKEFGIPAFSTMTHSLVQAFDTEYEAFKYYAEQFPNNCVLLVDTYSTVKSGVPNAIKVFDEVLKPMGVRPKGIRIDSGDITYLSKKARRMLDEAGYADCQITASNSINEDIVRDMLIQGAPVDSFAVGEQLITAASEPSLNGVYKLSAIEKDGELVPRIKISDNTGKITTPGFKTVWRLFDREAGKAVADVVTLDGEEIDQTAPYELFDPIHTWKRKTVDNFVARRLLQPIFVKGQCIYSSPTLPEIQSYCRSQISSLWEEVTRFENPHHYYVDMSQKLWDLRQQLLTKFSK